MVLQEPHFGGRERMRGRMSKAPAKNFTVRSVLDVLTSITLIAAAVTLIYKNTAGGSARAEMEVPSTPLSIQGAQLRGSKGARAVMIMYSDFQCPFCARFAKEVFPQIEQRYVATGSVALAFRHLPLPIHPQALQAAAVAECAGRQGKFWEMHDRLFAETSLNADTLNALPEFVDLGFQWRCGSGVDCAYVDGCFDEMGCDSFCFCEDCSIYGGPEGTAICN